MSLDEKIDNIIKEATRYLKSNKDDKHFISPEDFFLIANKALCEKGIFDINTKQADNSYSHIVEYRGIKFVTVTKTELYLTYK